MNVSIVSQLTRGCWKGLQAQFSFANETDEIIGQREVSEFPGLDFIETAAIDAAHEFYIRSCLQIIEYFIEERRGRSKRRADRFGIE